MVKKPSNHKPSNHKHLHTIENIYPHHRASPSSLKVRELHAKSQNDLCFKQKNVCAIWLQKGSELSDKDADAITAMEGKFAPKTDRGIRYNWMWMDIEQEAEFKVRVYAVDMLSFWYVFLVGMLCF